MLVCCEPCCQLKQKIRVVYTGDGETAQGLHSLFRTAWDGQPDSPVPIFGKGSNRLPMMHIADFAAYVTAVCASPPAQQYLLAVDDSRLAQRDVVTAVAAHLGKCPVREQALHEFMFQQASSADSHQHTSLNLQVNSALGLSTQWLLTRC